MTLTLNAVEPNSIIKYQGKLYRVTKEKKAINLAGQYGLLNEETEVEVVKNAEELAQSYLSLSGPLNELGNAFQELTKALSNAAQNAKPTPTVAPEEPKPEQN